MKSRGLLILLFTIAACSLFATHDRGGEITYKITGDYTVEATVTTYTKISAPSNLADRDSITIDWGDGTTSILPRVNGANDGTCQGASPCGIVITTDVKQNIYTGIHIYAGPPNNTIYYVISYTDDNLLGGIANIANGNSINIPFFIADTLYMGSNYNSLPGGFDASPVFLNPPKYYGFLSDTFTFNSAAYDPDGDSLSYSLIAPQQSVNNAVPQYVYPDSYCQTNMGSGNNTFRINAQTGQITWATPCIQGFFQFAIQVREYRCGLFIGNVMRNMQVIVLPQSINPPRLSNVYDTIIQPGQLLEFIITSHDSSGLSDSIQVLGGPFLDTLSINRPVFIDTTGNPATGRFTWQPDASFARSYPYLFTVISTDNYALAGSFYPASTTKTFRVRVESNDTAAPCVLSSIHDLALSDLRINIFPNPVNDVLHIQTSQQASNLLVSDLSGCEVLNLKPNSFNCDLVVSGLENGVYLLSIFTPGLTITRKFIKIE